MTNVPTGLVPQGRDNTGYAAIIGEREYNLAEMQKSMLLQQQQEKAAAAAKDQANLEKRKKAYGDLGYEPAWTRSFDELTKTRDNVFNLGIEIESKGGQIDDPSSPGGRLMSQAATGLKLAMAMDKAQKDKYYEWIDAYNQNPDQYPDFWKRMSEFDALGSIKERQDWMDKNNPLEKEWEYTDWLKRNAVDKFSSKIENGAITTQSDKIRFKDVQASIREDRKTPQGKRDYEKGLAAGTWKNEEEQELFAFNKIKAANPGSFTRLEDESKAGGFTFSSGGGISKKFGNWNVSASRRPSDFDPANAVHDDATKTHYYNWNNEIRQIDVAQNNKDTPVFYLKDARGNEINMQITGFERRNNDWYIKGKRIAEKGVKVDIPYKASDDPNESTVLEDVVIPYAGNEQDVAAKMNGFDINAFVRDAQSEYGKKAEKGYEENYKTQLLDMTDKSEDAMVGRVNALVSKGYTKVQSKEVETADGKRDTYIRFVDPEGKRVEYNLNNKYHAAAFAALMKKIM